MVPPKALQPLHVNYIPKLITKRKFRVMQQYKNRYYSPFIIILWIIVALQYHTCQVMTVVVPSVAIASSLYKTYLQYCTFYKDLAYIMESQTIQISVRGKIYYVVMEFLLHLMVACTTYWWIDNVHTCLSIDRRHQSYLFLVLISLSFFLHVVHHQQTKKETQYIVRCAYSHLNQKIDV